MKKVKRMPRVDELMRREIAEYIERMEFGIEKGLVTIGSVKTAPDLRTAKVGISTLNASEKDKRKILSILDSERSQIQARISRNIHIKYTPVLEFVLDDSFERGDRVLAIIRQIEEKEGKKEEK